MAPGRETEDRARALRVTARALAGFLVVMATAVALLSRSAAAGGIGFGLFALGYALAIQTLNITGSGPPGSPQASGRRAAIAGIVGDAVLVATALILAAAHASAVLTFVLGAVGGVWALGPALTAF